MNFREMMDRADIANIQSFLTYGFEGYKDKTEKTYIHRIEEAQSQISDFLKNCFDDISKRDEITELILSMTEVYEDVYFEAGLLLGAKLGYEMREKLEEIKNIDNALVV